MPNFYAHYPITGGGGGGGVISLNGMTGALTLLAGTGISITPGMGTLTISNTEAGGTVTSFSFVNANGFTGTVTNPTTTPALTLVGTLSGDITGTLTSTAITATTNSTLTTLSALSLPYSQITGGPAPGANTALSNLTTTAVNQSLVPGTNNNLNLGSPSLAWGNLYIGQSIFIGTGGELNSDTWFDAAGTYGVWWGNVGAPTLMAANGNNTISLGTASNAWSGIFTKAFQLSTSPASGDVLTSDASGNGSWSSLSGVYVPTSEVGAANGVASLDSSGKVPVGQLPSVVMEYEGAWNPNTNTPALSDGTGTNGNVYYVSALDTGTVPGNTDPSMVNFQIGDLVIYSSAVGKWQLVTPAAGVQSVNTAQGAVVLTVATANGFAGTYSSTALTLSTTITGILQGNGTSISAATTTGTGNVVLSASPTLTGTIAAGALTLSTALTVPNGGTGATSFSANQVILGGTTTTGALQQVTGGTSGYVLTSTGPTTAPTFQASSSSLVAPTVQKFTSGTGTYTTPTSPRAPLYIKVTIVGGGGGGSGSGSSGTGGTGGTGGTTAFGSSLMTAVGGGGGTVASGTAAAGGTASITASASVIQLAVVTGGTALGTVYEAVSTTGIDSGGYGAASYFGGAGAGGFNSAGNSASANSGSGGGGGGGAAANVFYSGGGGAAGGYAQALITSPSATYSYSVAAGGTSGALGTSGFAGGVGGSGYVLVEEYYQ